MARRRGRGRGRGRRRPSTGLGLGGFLAVAAVVVIVAMIVVQWLLAHWWLLLVLGLVGAVGGSVAFQQRRQALEWARAQQRNLRMHLAQLDAMGHQAFEFAVRDLMRRDGAKAERQGGGGDNACDVRAVDPYGRVWVFQVKHRRDGAAGSPIGTPVLQQVNGTARQIHKADVVVVLTNGRFSAPALGFGKSQRIHLVDRNLLGQWAAGAQPLWELLDRVPPPRRAP
jgi:restriction system protein